MNAGRRNYQDYSNEGGYYLLEVPKGTNTIRITGADITPIVFENYRIESNHANLDVTVCRNCKPLEFESGAINRPTQSAAGNTGKMIALGFDAFSLNL